MGDRNSQEQDREQQGINLNDDATLNAEQVVNNLGPQHNQTHSGTGDIVGEDKFIGDKVLRDKHVHIHALEQREPPVLPDNLGRFYRNRRAMVGRGEELERVHELLEGATKPIAIAGMGGVGKSELALQYGLERREFYGGGCVRVSAARFVEELVDFAQDRFLTRELRSKSPENRARKCWEEWPPFQEKPVLVIVDGVTDFGQVEAFLPWQEDDNTLGKFRVVLTTRCRFSGVATLDGVLELGRLSAGDARTLLLQRLKEEDPRRTLADDDNSVEIAGRVCEFVDGLPLALELMGRRLAQLPSLSLADLWGQLQGAGVRA